MTSWFFSKTKSNVPAPTALQTQRARQIATLKSFNQNVTEIRRDEEYRVNLTLGGTTSISLNITLPPQFPQIRPMVSVYPPVQHAWVDQQNRVTGCMSLNEFNMHKDLGKIVREIVEEFQRNPPQLQGQRNYSMLPNLPYSLNPPGGHVAPQGAAPPPFSGANTATPYSYTRNTGPSNDYMTNIRMPTLPPRSSVTSDVPSVPQHSIVTSQSSQPQYSSSYNNMSEHTLGTYKMPDIPTSFPQLRDLSVSELQELSENEDKLLEILQQLPEILKLGEDRQHMCNTNETIAKENIANRPVIEKNKEILLKRFDDLNELKTRFDTNSQKQDELRETYSARNIETTLKLATLEAEEQSEKIADEFLSKKIPIDDFIQQYLEKRSLCHNRRSKEEKLQQIVNSKRMY
ncbi:unnamed protein product [Owenia fusiformis]|uniref:Uncharacterized protein n=1 Tax=Owenia fusiformis TaxID=6347 RepID=A0A8J1TI20_OWEFU|nr:unnamed protein product [Owenia fusiformis]